jgi:hypothetical protein
MLWFEMEGGDNCRRKISNEFLCVQWRPSRGEMENCNGEDKIFFKKNPSRYASGLQPPNIPPQNFPNKREFGGRSQAGGRGGGEQLLLSEAAAPASTSQHRRASRGLHARGDLN